MKTTTMILVGSVLAFTAVGCAGNRTSGSPGYVGANDTGQKRDAALVRAEEQQLTQTNWRELENFLSARGYQTGPVDGVVTDQTRQAIMDFQKRNNIYQTGLADDHTLIEMARGGAGFSGTLGGQMRASDSDPTTIR